MRSTESILKTTLMAIAFPIAIGMITLSGPPSLAGITIPIEHSDRVCIETAGHRVPIKVALEQIAEETTEYLRVNCEQSRGGPGISTFSTIEISNLNNHCRTSPHEFPIGSEFEYTLKGKCVIP